MKTRTRNLLSLALGLTIAGTLSACGGGGSSSGGGSTASTGTATLTGNITSLGRQQVSMNSGLGVSTQLAYLAAEQLFAGNALEAMSCTSVTASVGTASTQVGSDCNFRLTGLPDGPQNLHLQSSTGTATIPVTLGANFTTRLNNIQMQGNLASSSSHTVTDDRDGSSHTEAGERNDDGSRNNNSNSHDNSNDHSNSNSNDHSNSNSHDSNDCSSNTSGCTDNS